MRPRPLMGASGRLLNGTVRLHVTRPAIAFATLLLLRSSQALAASNCSEPSPGDLATWVRSMVRQAHYVVIGRVTAVISLDAHRSTQVAVLDVQIALKGAPNLNRIRNTSSGPSFQPLVGKERVFFIDADGAIVDCSDYPSGTAERVFRKVERAFHGSAT